MGEEPEVKRHPVLAHLLVCHPIDHLLQVGQRCGGLGADLPEVPDGVNRVVGDHVTAVIHVQLVLDFIGVFIALNDKQIEGCAPPGSGSSSRVRRVRLIVFIRFSLGANGDDLLALLRVAAPCAASALFVWPSRTTPRSSL